MSEALAAAQPPQMAYRAVWKSPVVSWRDCNRERRELLQAAWSMGELGHLLTPSQQAADAKIDAWSARKDRKGRVFALDSSRRWGKSALLLKRAMTKAIQHKSWRIVYFAPEYRMVRKIILPLMAILTEDCPPGLLGPKHGPEWVKSEDTYYFKNGSRIEMIGLDTNPDGARGTGIDYGFGDEVAFFDNLEYLLQSVIKPQMLGRPHARLELASTPPVSPSHYWSSELVKQAFDDNAHDKRTIEDADQYSWEEIEEFIREAGGRRATTCRREYFCEHVTDETMAIVPEFRDVKDEIVKAWDDTPKWRDCYVSMDPGWKDHTAVLFGWWHFEAAKLIVEDEISAPRLNSDDIAQAVKAKEAGLWSRVMCRGSNGKLRAQPFMRVSDHNFQLINDLATMHGLTFVPTRKDDLDQQLNALRVAFSKKQIVIHPRCKRLIYDLTNGVWKNQAKKIFAHSSDCGHFDTIAALLYLWRNVRQRQNPAPKEENFVKSNRREDFSGHTEQPSGKASKWSRHGFKYRLK